MDVLTIIKVVAKRWFIALPAVLAVVLVVSIVSGRIEKQYEASVDTWLVQTPLAVDDPEYEASRQFGGIAGYRLLGTAAARLAYSGPYRQQLLGAGLSADFDIEADRDGILYYIRARANDPSIAVASAAQVAVVFDESLAQVQVSSGLTDRSRVRAEVIGAPGGARELTSDRMRMLSTLVAVGIIGAIALTLLGDAMLRSRELARQTIGHSRAAPRRRRWWRRRHGYGPDSLETA